MDFVVVIEAGSRESRARYTREGTVDVPFYRSSWRGDGSIEGNGGAFAVGARGRCRDANRGTGIDRHGNIIRDEGARATSTGYAHLYPHVVAVV